MKKQLDIRIVIVAIVVGYITFSVGIVLGRKQSKDWNATSVHRSLQVEGFNYCPYCGEKIKEV